MYFIWYQIFLVLWGFLTCMQYQIFIFFSNEQSWIKERLIKASKTTTHILIPFQEPHLATQILRLRNTVNFYFFLPNTFTRGHKVRFLELYFQTRKPHSIMIRNTILSLYAATEKCLFLMTVLKSKLD